MENIELQKTIGELITCRECKKKFKPATIARQIRSKTVKRLEIQSHKGGGISNTAIIFPREYLKNGKLKIPVLIECPVCHTKNLITFVIENLYGITFSYKGEGIEIINGKKKIITRKDSRQIYKIYLKFKKSV